MGLFTCFNVFLPQKIRHNKIHPLLQHSGANLCHKVTKDPWNSLVSSSHPVIFWETVPAYKPKLIRKENIISKPGGMTFDVMLGKKASFDIFAIPRLPPKRLPPIYSEDIESLKRPKRIKSKGRGKKSKLTVDEKLAKAKARRERAESEKRGKTLRKLNMVVPE